MQNLYQKLNKWFNQYTAQFELAKEKDQNNINLKIEHSRRVAQDMSEIIKEMKMTEAEKYLAQIIALYHDIGRFKQYQK